MSRIEQELMELLEPAVAAMGCELIGIIYRGSPKNALLRLYIDKPGGVDLDDCTRVSHHVSGVLDVEDPIGRAYHLEISSPGIDRQLVRKSDFLRWAGYSMKLETSVLINGKKRFKGKLNGADDDGFNFEADQIAYGESPRMHVPFDVVADARLILTDELIREALKRDKALREAQGTPDEAVDDETGGEAAN